MKSTGYCRSRGGELTTGWLPRHRLPPRARRGQPALRTRRPRAQLLGLCRRRRPGEPDQRRAGPGPEIHRPADPDPERVADVVEATSRAGSLNRWSVLLHLRMNDTAVLVAGDYEGVLIASRPRPDRDAWMATFAVLTPSAIVGLAAFLPLNWLVLAVLLVASLVASTVMVTVSHLPFLLATGRTGLQTPDWIGDLVAVRPEHEGRGLGTALVAAAHRGLLAEGEQAVFLAAPDLHDFFMRAGAQPGPGDAVEEMLLGARSEPGWDLEGS